MTGPFDATSLLRVSGKRARPEHKEALQRFFHHVGYGFTHAKKGPPRPDAPAIGTPRDGRADPSYPARAKPWVTRNPNAEAFLDWSVLVHSYGAQRGLTVAEVTRPVGQSSDNLRFVLTGGAWGLPETRQGPTYMLFWHMLDAGWSVADLVEDVFRRGYWRPPGVVSPDFHIADGYFRTQRPARLRLPPA